MFHHLRMRMKDKNMLDNRRIRQKNIAPGITWVIVLCCCFVDDANAKELPKGFALYCKEKNCYDILGVSPGAVIGEIKKAYRRLSLVHHPDKSDAADSVEKFMEIANAYEILSSESMRKAYDDFLAHPERHVWQHYSNYYQAYYVPKSDVRLVFLGIVAVASIVQYLSESFKRSRSIRVVLEQNKTKLFIKQRVNEMGGLSLNLKKKDQAALYFKLEAAAEKEVLDRTVVNGMKLGDGILVEDILAMRIILLPLDVLRYVIHQLRWLLLFTILRREYGVAEKEELTRILIKRSLGIDWDVLSPEDRQDLVGRELWIAENLKQMEQDEREHMEEERRKVAQSSRYKSYRRWVKKNT